MFVIQPYNDELLSSWFIRLARVNHTNVSSIVRYIFQDDLLSEHTKKFHIKDMDLYELSDEQKNILYLNTGVSINELQLFKYSGFLDESIDRYKKLWISEPNATKHNTKKFLGPRYCPKCLEEKPYIRQLWRIMLYNICAQHNCYLLCQCQFCNEKFMYYDNGYTKKMYVCHKCNFDLRKSKVIYVTKTKHLINQSKIMNILQVGYYKLYNRYYYSIGLFKLLKSIVLSMIHLKNKKIKYIKQITPCELAKYISHAMFLLEKFPTRLNKCYKNNGLTDIHNILHWNDRDKKKCNLPNWFLNGIEYSVITKTGKIKVIKFTHATQQKHVDNRQYATQIYTKKS